MKSLFVRNTVVAVLSRSEYTVQTCRRDPKHLPRSLSERRSELGEEAALVVTLQHALEAR